jgi:hypothetical protein
MCQGAPVWCLAAQEKWQTAIAVVRLFVREHERDITRRIELVRAEPCGNADVTAANDEEVHVSIHSGFVEDRHRNKGPPGASSSVMLGDSARAWH